MANDCAVANTVPAATEPAADCAPAANDHATGPTEENPIRYSTLCGTIAETLAASTPTPINELICFCVTEATPSQNIPRLFLHRNEANTLMTSTRVSTVLPVPGRLTRPVVCYGPNEHSAVAAAPLNQ